MNVSWRPGRRHGLHALIFCAQVACIALATHAYRGKGAWFAVIAVALLGMFGWLRALATLRQISDTPVSRIASAAQGYVALRGRGRPLAGLPLLSPFNGLPVLWYRLLIEEKDSDGNWQSRSDEESDACLLLQDDSGTCAIDPAGAQVMSTHREHETRGDLRYTHHCILENDALYVLGDFHTLHGETLTRSEREAVKEILADWKQDRPELLRRFDLDKDGEIDENEWALARAAAQREARTQRIEADRSASVHIVRKSSGARPFIVSAVKAWRLKLPFLLLCAMHIAFFLLACIGIAALVQNGQLELT